MECFSHIAAPLHALTQRNTTFCWYEACQQGFTTLKERLTPTTVLQYPQFHSAPSQFVMYIDASDVGLGVILEQDNHVITYASCVLNKSEQNYSVIQKECLAIVYATKQFRHTYWEDSFSFAQTTLHCSGYQPNAWKAYCVDGY